MISYKLNMQMQSYINNLYNGNAMSARCNY